MSLFGPLQTGCLVAFALLLLLAAWQDLRTMHIADAISLAIVVALAIPDAPSASAAGRSTRTMSRPARYWWALRHLK